jgi:hypothetical protein
MQSIKTPLGNLQISLSAVRDQADQHAIDNCIQIISFKPALPTGMAVSGCFVAVASISPKVTLRNLLFCARLHTSSEFESGPETGEHLDALGFYSATHVLLVGTEDTDILSARLKSAVRLPEAPPPFTRDSMTVQISEVTAGEKLSLHFAIAWNSLPEPQDGSCWYAVDQNHANILSALATHH